MFKNYIDNHPNSHIAYFYNAFIEYEKIQSVLTKQCNKKHGIYLLSGISLMIASGFFMNSDVNSLECWIFMILFSLGFSLSMASGSFLPNALEKAENIFVTSIHAHFQSKENTASLIKELNTLQQRIQSHDLEILIHSLKGFYLNDNLLTSEYLTELSDFITDNYETINTSTLNKNGLDALEYEIGMTNLQKIL